MDRFLLHVFVKHPSDENERRILQLVRGEEAASMSTGNHPPGHATGRFRGPQGSARRQSG